MMEPEMRKWKRSRVARPKQLPEDIIVEILSRLPVKTLVKFKIVCNQWKSLISHKIFSLRNDGRCREKPLFFFRRVNKDLIGTKFSTYLSLSSDLLVEEFDNPFSDYQFLGSCDGLLLFGYGTDIYLWNPSTRYSKAVHHLLSLVYGYRRMLASGFCYDDSVDDYKVVIIISQPRKSERPVYAFVSHLKSITWTKVSCPYEVLRTDWVAPMLRGNLHILAQEKEGKNGGKQHPNAPQLILCFDTKRDEFKLLPKPDPKHDGQNIVYGLGVIEGCLCMVRPDKHCREVLTMREYGVKESWTVLFRIVNWFSDVPRYSLVPVFLTNKGEVVMVEHHTKILAYDLKSRSLLVIRQQKCPEDKLQLFGFPYVESVADGNQARPQRRKRSNKLGDFIYFSYLDHL